MFTIIINYNFPTENFGLQASLRFPTSPPPEHVLFINAVVAKAKQVNIVRYQNSATIRKNTAAILAQEKIQNDVIHLANLQQNDVGLDHSELLDQHLRKLQLRHRQQKHR